MDQKQLLQYRAIAKEIKYLDSKIKRTNDPALKLKRESELQKLIQTENSIHDFIYSIEDSELRLILSLRYIEGMSQEKIGEQIFLDRSGISRRLTKYLGGSQ